MQNPDTAATDAAPRTAGQQGLAALTLAAIGVVYGDIGTSPLYTVKEIFAPHTGVPLDAPHLIGAVSTIFWALMLVVTLKYVILILRADNHGEGGGLALTALAARAVEQRPALRSALLLLGVFGATLFYGDSLITPAISVLGAMEGLELVTPALKDYVVPISVVILVALFLMQRHGTAFVGRFFGPIIVLWFVVLGITGVLHIAHQPAILAALNPWYAWAFLAERGWHLFAAMGATDEQLDFPHLYASGKQGWAVNEMGDEQKDLGPLYEKIVAHVPAPKVEANIDQPAAMLAVLIESDPFLGRLLTGRVEAGKLVPGMAIKALSRDGTEIERGRVTKLLAFRGLKRQPVDSAEAQTSRM